MAFIYTNLNNGSPSEDLRIWNYTTSDTLSTIEGEEYFTQPAARIFRIWDILVVDASDGFAAYYVNSGLNPVGDDVPLVRLV